MKKYEYQKLLVIEDFAILSNSKKTVVHQFISMPSDAKNREETEIAFLYFIHANDQLLQSEQLKQENQVKEMNAPGLHLLSFWLNEFLKESISAFPFFSADEFQLEAWLRQFDIEVNSIFLKRRLEELRNSKDSEEQKKELNRLLAIQFVVLSELKLGIEKILSQHKELSNIYEKVTLFYEILLTHLVKREQDLFYYLLFEKQMNLQPIIIGSIANAKVKRAVALWLTIQTFPHTFMQDEEFTAAYKKHYQITFNENP